MALFQTERIKIKGDATMTKTYQLSEIHKIEATKSDNGVSVKFFELMGHRWVQLGPADTFATWEDFRMAYGK